jgi:hypothetical protein
MATLDDVARISLALPEAVERFQHNALGWAVHDKGFAWVRPLRPGDIAALGDDVPEGEIIAIRTADLDEQRALVEGEPEYFFATPHFANYPAVLIKLDAIPVDRLTEAIEESWVARAPKRLSKPWLAERGIGGPSGASGNRAGA